MGLINWDKLPTISERFNQMAKDLGIEENDKVNRIFKYFFLGGIGLGIDCCYDSELCAKIEMELQEMVG